MLKLVLAFWLFFMNLLAFVAMGLDKWKAKHHRYRIPERILFLFVALGGSLGGMMGMAVFRHKTRRRKFQIGFPVLFFFQVILLIWLGYEGVILN
ncbi:DUF1294 domain-containing protein [Hominifimenecus sp. rT4P-3]|uniref:DUF1294 domain-containing protein n=1 Tax=Hominifimenecus sp. rT4P-3 TaxID=3242979 RepID=UPI003DA69773